MNTMERPKAGERSTTKTEGKLKKSIGTIMMVFPMIGLAQAGDKTPYLLTRTSD